MGQTMSSAELRSAFLEFFRERDHAVVPSSSLVPANDPTLLFTNAGMVQFKDVFLGVERRPYVRAASAQRCVRAGGKHNDLDNVGFTARHHTFFEMLGNFSFGDYFKRHAIGYAWEFLTGRLGIAPERLWVTVYENDEEAADIWLQELGVDPSRFARCGAADNFWSMGDTGPCGPCSEIFYDHGPGVPGGPPGTPEADGDRYVEIWNLVFMQYERAADGSQTPLPKPSVDTGMGLERLAAVMQGVHDNYDTDLFTGLIEAIARLAGLADHSSKSLRVIADHIRSCSFLIADGVLPANEGRGYVLRRIIRRGALHGHKLGLVEPFLHRLVQPLLASLEDAHPELARERVQVERVLLQEEQRFAETLEQGLRLLDQAVAGLRGDTLDGETVFKLYDTYGFPVDLTQDVARERGLRLDLTGFDRAMAAQRERARAAGQFRADYRERIAFDRSTEFDGYERLHETAKIVGIFRGGQPVQAAEQDEGLAVILERTPFYAESGGQVGDRGLLRAPGAELEVRDTQKQAGGAYLHLGTLRRGRLAVGDTVEAAVDARLRRATALNHSATHLLHAALRQVLGAHVTQKGSLVDPERLRFDFSHFEPVQPEALMEIERLVNREIRSNHPVQTTISTMDEAVASGAMALFGEKYGEQVRVLSMGEFSVELCGGTHVSRTGDIGFCKIVGESGVAAGVRRIEAITGERALRWVEDTHERLERVAQLVKSSRDGAEEKVRQVIERARGLEKEIERLKVKLASSTGTDLSAQAVEVAGTRVLAAAVDGADRKALRETVDRLKDKLGSAVILLASVEDGKVSLVAGATKDCAGRVRAGDLVRMVAEQIGGKGGGRPDMAEGGGTTPSELPKALGSVAPWVRARLS